MPSEWSNANSNNFFHCFDADDKKEIISFFMISALWKFAHSARSRLPVPAHSSLSHLSFSLSLSFLFGSQKNSGSDVFSSWPGPFFLPFTFDLSGCPFTLSKIIFPKTFAHALSFLYLQFFPSCLMRGTFIGKVVLDGLVFWFFCIFLLNLSTNLAYLPFCSMIVSLRLVGLTWTFEGFVLHPSSLLLLLFLLLFSLLFLLPKPL